MDKYIEIDKLKSKINEKFRTLPAMRRDLNDMIDQIPTVDTETLKKKYTVYAETVKRGKWKIKKKEFHTVTQGYDEIAITYIYECSECGRTIKIDEHSNPLDYCPYCHCGAKMSVDDSENEFG